MSGKSWYLAPNFDNPPPPDGTLDLGSLVTSFEDDVPLNSQPLALPLTTKVVRPDISCKTGFSATREELRVRNFGIWAQIYESKNKMSFGKELDENEKLVIDTVQTTFFNPPRQYIEESLKDEDVQFWIGHTKWRKPLYMVTGLKYAHGARWTHSTSAKHSLGMEAGIDGRSLGAPLGAGVGLDLTKRQKDGTAFETSSDFIFAIRFSRITFERHGVIEKRQTKNALFDSEAAISNQEKVNVDVDIDIAEVQREDFRKQGLDIQEFEDADHDVWYICA
jgi:hypothetical protein